MDCSPPGSSVHGIFQARVLDWVAIFFSRASSQPRDRTWVSHIVGRRFTIWATREALVFAYMSSNKAFLSPLCYRLSFLEDFRLRWCALWFKKIRFYKHHIKCILLNLSFFKNQNYILNINKLLFLSVYIEKNSDLLLYCPSASAFAYIQTPEAVFSNSLSIACIIYLDISFNAVLENTNFRQCVFTTMMLRGYNFCSVQAYPFCLYHHIVVFCLVSNWLIFPFTQFYIYPWLFFSRISQYNLINTNDNISKHSNLLNNLFHFIFL